MVNTSSQILEVEMRAVKQLSPYKTALRNNSQAVQCMIASIREYGFKIPLLVSEENVIVDGELRLKAAQKLKYTDSRNWQRAPPNGCHGTSARQRPDSEHAEKRV